VLSGQNTARPKRDERSADALLCHIFSKTRKIWGFFVNIPCRPSAEDSLSVRPLFRPGLSNGERCFHSLFRVSAFAFYYNQIDFVALLSAPAKASSSESIRSVSSRLFSMMDSRAEPMITPSAPA